MTAAYDKLKAEGKLPQPVVGVVAEKKKRAPRRKKVAPVEETPVVEEVSEEPSEEQ